MRRRAAIALVAVVALALTGCSKSTPSAKDPGQDPNATIERLAVDGLYVTVEAAERLQLPLSFLGAPAVKLRAKATARLTLGYERPSSFLPFSVSTL